jgi:hypothetical protein
MALRSHPASLPLELYRPILGHLDSPGDLCSAARVSRYLQLESEQILYEAVAFHSLEFDAALRGCIAFLKRVSACSRRALLVQSLKINVKLERYTSLASTSFLRLLSRGLERLTNLSDLVLVVQELSTGQVLPGSWILDRCTFKLHSLYPHFSVPDHSLLSFLQTQDGLRQLRLFIRPNNLLPETYCLSPKFLPNLVVLAAADVDAFRLILIRPITLLAVLNAPWGRSDWRAGFKAGIALKALCIQIPMSAEDLVEIPKFTPKLELFSVYSNTIRTEVCH